MSYPCPYGLCDGSGFVVDEDGSAEPCRCRPERLARSKSTRLSAVIPKRYQGLAFDRPPVTLMDPSIVSFVRDYAAQIEQRIDKGRGLWLMGPSGTGKTTLAMLVAQAAIEARKTVAIYSLPRLLAELRRTFDDDGDSQLQLLDRLTAVDLLHLDDVGAERSSEWVLEQLYAVVNARYEAERSIVITTNLNPLELNEQISQRTVSRLQEMCGDPLPLEGVDNRIVVRAQRATTSSGEF